MSGSRPSGRAGACPGHLSAIIAQSAAPEHQSVTQGRKVSAARSHNPATVVTDAVPKRSGDRGWCGLAPGERELIAEQPYDSAHGPHLVVRGPTLADHVPHNAVVIIAVLDPDGLADKLLFLGLRHAITIVDVGTERNP